MLELYNYIDQVVLWVYNIYLALIPGISRITSLWNNEAFLLCRFLLPGISERVEPLGGHDGKDVQRLPVRQVAGAGAPQCQTIAKMCKYALILFAENFG